jgi:hypothetical protein
MAVVIAWGLRRWRSRWLSERYKPESKNATDNKGFPLIDIVNRNFNPRVPVGLMRMNNRVKGALTWMTPPSTENTQRSVSVLQNQCRRPIARYCLKSPTRGSFAPGRPRGRRLAPIRRLNRIRRGCKGPGLLRSSAATCPTPRSRRRRGLDLRPKTPA